MRSKGCFICELFAYLIRLKKEVNKVTEKCSAGGCLGIVSLGKGFSASRSSLKVGVFIPERLSDLCLVGVGVHGSGCYSVFHALQGREDR